MENHVRDIPSPADCERILAAAGCAPAVVSHTRAVAQLARPIAQAIHAHGTPIDIDLVSAAAHLHDIGRSRTQGLDHALVGAQLLRAEGLPEALCLIVERHTGGGIDIEEARLLGLPLKDYTPMTLEEKIVCQADNLIDDVRRQKVHEELAHLRARGLERVATKIEGLHAELSRLAGRDLDEIP